MIGQNLGFGAVQGPMTYQQPNIYQQSAGAFNNALGGTQAAMSYNPGAAMATATPAIARNYTAYTGQNLPTAQAGGYQATGYDAAQMGPADQVQAGQFAGMDLNPYLNPYTDTVINQASADMERARRIEQNQREAQMAAAGAFGGSRHGVADAEASRGFYDRLGAMTGGLRNQGFEMARGSAFQDIGNRMNADLANQAANMNVGQFNTGADNRAREFSAAAENQAGQVGAQVSMQNAAMQNARNAQIMDAMNQSRRFGAQNRSDMSRFNSGLEAELSQFNAGAQNQYDMNRINTLMSGGAQMGNLANLGFGMGNTITAQQSEQGAQDQALQQQLLNLAQQQFGNFFNQGRQSISDLTGAVAGVPAPVSTTTSSDPGLVGRLSSAAGIMGTPLTQNSTIGSSIMGLLR